MTPQLADGELVKVAGAENQPEAELLQNILPEGGVPSVLRRSRGFDVPDFLAAGQRDVLVRASSQLELARAVLPHADPERLQPLSGAVGVPLRFLARVLITVALIPVVLWLAEHGQLEDQIDAHNSPHPTEHSRRGVFHHARTEGRVSGVDPERSDYGSFASFSDPDGNG